MEDHYETLGVPRDATQEQIRAAFRRVASEAHPDRQGGSTERMQAVNAAYAVLSDEERRAAYDAGEFEGSPIAVARAILHSIFVSALRQNSQDPFKFATEQVNSSERIAKLEAGNLRQAIERLESQRMRIAPKGKSDLFHEALDAQIRAAEHELRGYEQNVENCKHVLQLLNDEYERGPNCKEPTTRPLYPYAGFDLASGPSRSILAAMAADGTFTRSF